MSVNRIPRYVRGCFISGTDTGIGKTIVAAALLRGLAAANVQAVGMKPIAAGAFLTAAGLRNDDALALAAAGSVTAPYGDTNPYCFEPAISPHLAARKAGVVVDLGIIRAAFERLAAISEYVIVEGAGGWLAPVGPALTIADIAIAIGLPVVLVVGVRLGCLNHARLSVEAIRARGVPLCAWVANAVDPQMQCFDENLASLIEIIGCQPLVVMPHDAHAADRAVIAPEETTRAFATQ